MIQSTTLTLTGAATGYLGSRLRGRVLAIKSDADLNAAYTVAITGETSGIPILAAAAVSHNSVTWFFPFVEANQNTDGAASGSFIYIPLLNERIKVITSIAASGTVTFTLYWDSED